MTWGFLNSRLNREPIDSSSLNNSYTDLLWELNQVSSTYEIGKPNTGGSSNFYVGLITAVPYVNKGNGNNENPNMKGPWYVTYCGTDANEGTGKFAFTGHIDDKVQAANTYYADRIVLKRELDYSLEKNTVSPLLLGTYYTGVGHWYDSYTKAKEYAGKELPDGTYFPTTSYAEIFNDYTNNIATGKFSHAEGSNTTASGEQSHAEGSNTRASGQFSHAEGSNTIATNKGEHAQGRYNVSDTNNSGTLFTIGNGTAGDKRHNVVGIYYNGDINIEGQNTTNHNIGYFKSTIDGNYTQTIGTTNKNNTCNVTINGTSNTRISGATYEGYDSTFISTTKDAKSTYSYSTTYTYSEGDVTDTTAGTRTVVTDGDVSIINKTNIDIVTNGTHTENIDTTRSTVVGDHDSLVVNSNGRTEKITGEKITQVISGNINAYTDTTHDTRLNTRSAYLETVHAYIGDNTNTAIDGNYSVGLGQGIKVSSDTNVTVGKYNKDEASYFAVGIGTDDVNRKNAFWISQGNTSGTNGVAYFSNNTYVYANNHDPGIYPEKKDEKEWSNVVTYAMYRNSYTYLYKTLNTQIESISSNLDKLTKKIEELSGNINTLQDKAILKSTATGNTAKYLWSGNLDAFNNINTTQKTNDTTFIITN